MLSAHGVLVWPKRRQPESHEIVKRSLRLLVRNGQVEAMQFAKAYTRPPDLLHHFQSDSVRCEARNLRRRQPREQRLSILLVIVPLSTDGSAFVVQQQPKMASHVPVEILHHDSLFGVCRRIRVEPSGQELRVREYMYGHCHKFCEAGALEASPSIRAGRHCVQLRWRVGIYVRPQPCRKRIGYLIVNGDARLAQTLCKVAHRAEQQRQLLAMIRQPLLTRPTLNHTPRVRPRPHVQQWPPPLQDAVSAVDRLISTRSQAACSQRPF